MLASRTDGQPAWETEGAYRKELHDDRRWEFSAGRRGGTLIPVTLPGTDRVSTIYFPEREASYVPMLFTSFPDDVTELVFSGP